MDLTEEHPDAAMRFLLKRWGSSQDLKLKFETFTSAWASNLPPQAAALKDLQTLSMSVRASAPRRNSWPYFMEWLAWVLGHCTSLKYLALCHTSPVSLPPLAALRHLVLWFAKYQPEMLASVLQIWGLQTLQLVFMPPHVMLAPLLQLTGLRSLQHVSLRNLHFQDLALPPHCTIHVLIFGQDAPSAAFLGSIRNALVGLSINRPLLAGDDMQQDLGPTQILLEALGPRCVDLQWRCQAFGSALQPLRFPASLASLRRLYLSADSVCICLPAELQLQGCHLHATLYLKVALDDPAAMACSLVDLSLKSTQLRGWDLMSLFWQLGKVGKRVEPLLVDEIAKGMQIGGCRAPSPVDSSWCACGACLPCLRQSGRL